jgi:hypothetical protein
MMPPGHIAISLSIGGVLWLLTRSVPSVLVSLLVGVLMDLDHILDYYLWLVKEDRQRLFLLLHGYELFPPILIAAILLGWHPLLLAGALAFLAHLLTDQFSNRARPLTYFLTYRALKGFRLKAVVDWKEEFIYEEMTRLPFVKRLLRIFSR